jgi:SAM-dependent methyltransferase
MVAKAQRRKPTFTEAMAHAGHALDWRRQAEIEADLKEARASERKFLDMRRWLGKAWHDAHLAGLLDAPARRVLDIGTGGAHFPFLCRYLGHEIVALDRPGTPVFDALAGWMGVDVVPHAIAPRKPLPPLGGRFDLVTAFRVAFHKVRGKRLFHLAEWEFFLDDLRDNVLVEGGGLCMKMNEDTRRVGTEADDNALFSYFKGRGARVLGSRTFVFDPLQ